MNYSTIHLVGLRMLPGPPVLIFSDLLTGTFYDMAAWRGVAKYALIVDTRNRIIILLPTLAAKNRIANVLVLGQLF
jgi:hypothetical protein